MQRCIFYIDTKHFFHKKCTVFNTKIPVQKYFLKKSLFSFRNFKESCKFAPRKRKVTAAIAQLVEQRIRNA